MDSSFSVLMFCAAAIGFFMILGTLLFMVYKKFRSSSQNNKTVPSSSPPLSPPPSVPHHCCYHVFPSFHGSDVRRSFLSHVLLEFRRKGIDLFIDNDIERSKSIGPEVIDAIRRSKIALVMLSRNYASSSWCLDELVEIMKCREELGQLVVTVFYEVDPTDVKKQTGDFGKLFKKTCKGKTKERGEIWRRALAQVATIAGFHSRSWNNEASMIENLTTRISNVLNDSAPSRDFDGLVGMGAHMEKMESILCLDSDEARMIGILGPSGIGKTTIARYLYNKHSHQFQLSVFMTDIKSVYPRLCYDEYSAKLQLQNQMLSQLLNHKEDINICHLGVLPDRLKDKKVLVVLDGVDRLEQLDALAKKTRWYGPGSLIIITTQDPRLLKAHGINQIYKTDFPAPDEALQIFCMHAFGQKSPKYGFMKLSKEATELAGVLPLRLKLMGRSLRGRSRKAWTEALPRLCARVDREIRNLTATDISNNSQGQVEMEAHVEKTEPILCMDSDEENMVEAIVSDTEIRLNNSAIVSEIEIRLNNSPSLSDLENIVGMEAHMEKIEPMLCMDSDEVRIIGIVGPSGIGKTTIAHFLYQQLSHQFQWSTIMANIQGFNGNTYHNEHNAKLHLQKQLLSQLSNQNYTDEIFPLGVAQEMLKDKKVFIVLDDVDSSGQLDALAKETHGFGIGSRIIITTRNERLLKEYGIDHIYKVDFPSPDDALQIFCMYTFGQKSPCDGFVELAQEVTTLSGEHPLGLQLMGTYLQGMSKKEWINELPTFRSNLDGGIMSIVKLTYDSLCGEDKESFHNQIACISNGDCNVTVEEYLAKSFSEVGQEVIIINQDIKDLYTNDSALEGFDGLLRRECCPVTRWPSKWYPESLYELYIPHSKFEKLWEGIRPLGKLRLMDLSSSKNLKKLPDLSTAFNLKRLDLSCCSSIVELPYSIGDATGLLVLTLEYCTSLVGLPSSIGNITNLKELYLTGCSSLVELPSSIGNAINLQELYLRCCSSLVKLPSSVGSAINLQKLNLEYCSSLVKLPSSIGDAINLKELYLAGCSSLVELPASIGNATNLQQLNLEYCSRLVRLPSSIGNAINLKELYLTGCSSLVELPPSIGNATSLEILDVSNCSGLVDLPYSIGNFNNLHYLDISNCSCLVSLPNSIGSATNLWELDLSNCSSLVELPSSIGNVSGLRKVDLSNCSNLVELPSSIGNATNLEYLYLSNCSSLRKLPSSIGYATSLQCLYLSNCSNLMEVPYSIGNAINLRILDLSWCTSLVKLPASILNSTSLWQLDLDNCSNLLEVPNGVRLKKLVLSW
ncbi:PREDICTED: probable disease resistance protein RPP1 [Camelina sativa]|uniref:Probable disease resistance protein RPP1 n=1 Tax=Camelina sativa TaxID=90675 RepID=A0ABM0U858_CAMSA|nr:PREDICTED: probable disease resistance protein RPP1 [Camelina sativa]